MKRWTGRRRWRMSNALLNPPGRAQALLGRLDAVPFSRWHVKSRILVGGATFFDAFDALALAFVLPLLKTLWKLDAAQIGLLISAAYLGQFFGALAFGALADRLGRVRTISVAAGLMSVMAIGCALTGGFAALLVCRFVQGFGLGGEVPVAATYVNELSPAHARGRFFILYEMIFVIGLVAAGQLGAWLVPSLGWKSMFLVGGVPGLVISVSVWLLPESPRWLIARGRFDQAERVIEKVEASTSRRNPPPPLASVRTTPRAGVGWGELFSSFYRRRTGIVWALWFLTYFVANGLNNWLPTLYQSVYHLPLRSALRAASLTNVVQVVITLAAALLIERVGRRGWAVGCFVAAGLVFLALGALDSTSVIRTGILATAAYGLLSSVNVLLYLYTGEIYPTRLRAMALGLGTAWLRLGSSAGPSVVGVALQNGGVARVFLVFAGACAVGLFVATRMIETTGRPLEEIAP